MLSRLLIICFTCIPTFNSLQAAELPASQAIDKLIAERMQSDNIPGLAIAVLQHGNVLKQKAYGLANIELGVPVHQDSVFEVASLTKQFTAAAILMLAEQNRLSLDDKLVDHLKGNEKRWGSITIKQLLSHSAGLTHRFERTVNGVFLTDYSTAQMLANAQQTAMKSEPGTDWSYSDQGYFLLGLIIEKVTQQGYAEFLQEAFFKPLNMTTAQILQQSKIIPNRVAGYRVSDGAIENIRRDWQFGLTSHFGVMSSINDLIKWEAALVSGELMSKQLLSRFWSPIYIFQQNPTQDSLIAYGHGWWVKQQNGRRSVEHSGFTGTAYFRDLQSQLSVIVLTNRDQPSGQGTMSIAHQIAKLVDPTIVVQ